MKRQRGKDGVSSATLAGRLSPGVLPIRGRGGGGGGGGESNTVRRGKTGPEGYKCWIAPALDSVRERKQEI